MQEQIQSSPTPTSMPPIAPEVLRTRAAWKALGYCVPTKERPMRVELYVPPGYRSVTRERHLFGFAQVYKVDPEVAKRRSETAARSVHIRIKNMEKRIEEVELTIVRGKTDDEIYELARSTHGGNYQGDPGEFFWSKRKARNAIRHCLTNYEAQWAKINRGITAKNAYTMLRYRIDGLVDEAYPQYADE